MEYETFLNIADIILRIKSNVTPEQDEEKTACRYKNFLLNRSPKNIDIDLTLKVKPDYTRFNPEIIFETRRERVKRKGGSAGRRRKKARQADKLQKEKEKYMGKDLDWRIGKVGKKILLEGGASGSYQVLLEEDLKKGEAFIINSHAGWKISDIVYGFLQVFSIYYLAKYRLGIVLHSAGIKDGRNGYIFAGQSQAGKTTTSRIWDEAAGIKILNDDRVIIRKKSNQFFIYSTPWHGDFSDYLREPIQEARLKNLFFIYHNKENKAERLPSRESFKLFFQTIFSSFWDKACLQFTSEFLLDIIFSIPCYKFGFKNDERIVDYVRQLTTAYINKNL